MEVKKTEPPAQIMEVDVLILTAGVDGGPMVIL
jgi:hypothetical protein